MLCRSLWMLGWGESQSSEPLSSPFPAWSASHLYLLHLPFDILSSSHQTNRQQPPQQQWQYCSWSHPEMGPDFTLIPPEPTRLLFWDPPCPQSYEARAHFRVPLPLHRISQEASEVPCSRLVSTSAQGDLLVLSPLGRTVSGSCSALAQTLLILKPGHCHHLGMEWKISTSGGTCPPGPPWWSHEGETASETAQA